MARPSPALSLGSCLLQESPSRMASRSFISALTPTPGLLAAFWGSTTRAGCPWGSAFPRCQKVPGSLFEPPFLSILPDLGGSCAGRNPRRPALGPPGAMEPAWPRLSSVGVLGLAHPEAHPVYHPPSSSLSTAFQTLPNASGASNAQGAGGALWGGTCPYLPQPSKGSPLPLTGSPWGEMSSCPSLGHGGWSGVPQGPHNSLYICINKWDFNGTPLPPCRYHCVIVCLSPLLALHSLPLFISLFFGFHPEPSDPSQIPVYKPVPLSWTCM